MWVVSCLLPLVSCFLFGVWRLAFGVLCLLYDGRRVGVWFWVFGFGCMLFVVCRLLSVVCCLVLDVFVRHLLYVGCCLLSVVCC